MPGSKISDASRMLVYLKKEEAFYKNLLSQLEQESIRLQVEAFSITAAIRSEEMSMIREKDSQNVRRHRRRENKNSVEDSASIIEENIPSVSSQGTSGGDDFSINDVFSPPPNSVGSMSSELPEIETIVLNINDDRYYEPLCLNITKDENLVEFDDDAI